MKKFSEFICNHTKLIIIISGILLVLSVFGSMLTKINYDILVYLPNNIETVKGQKILTNDFEMGAYSIAIVENMNSKDLLTLQNDIKKVDGVNKVISIYDLIGTSIPIEMLPTEVRDKIHKDNVDLLFITFNDGTSAETTLKAVDSIREITKENVKLSGMSSMVLDNMNLSKKEILIYIVIAVLLCILVLELSLDSYLAPIFLLLNIGFAVLVNLGTNMFLGSISYITKALVAVLQLGVTTDFSIFLYHSYEDKKKEYKDRKKAMSAAIQETFTSVTGSSLTTIAGFLVLCTMSLTLGRDLGIVMAKGVFLGVISVLTLYPSLLLIFDKILTKTKHKIIMPNFNKLNNFIVKYHVLIFIVFIVLVIPMYLSYSKVEVYYKIDRSMPSYLDSVKSNKILKEEFNIVSPEIVLVNNSLKFDDLISLSKELESVEGIEFALTPAKLLNYGITDNMISEELVKTFKNDKYQMIIINSLYDIASDELNDQVGIINEIVKKYDENAIVAGEGPLMKDLIKTSDTDFNNVNISSIICIFLILFIVLRSFSLPFFLISTIEFAIFMNMGISYFDGTVLPFVAPIVIGTIQLGATIDYAILMTSTYLEKRKSGLEKKDAMIETLNYSGHSIFISGMCFFAATFGVGVYSKLEMVGFLCTLISRGALISMLVVITILPSILLIFDKLILKTSINVRKVINMNKSKILKNVSIWIMLISIIISSLPLNTYAISKNETVYTKLDYSGNVKSVVVNEQLTNVSDLDRINDYTLLNDIVNLSNNNNYYKDGNKITWENGKKDIVYQGTTDKNLPISLNITYKLDKKEIELDDLLGKSGHIDIIIKYTNKEKHNTSNGILYTPFVVVTSSIISVEGNTNFSINNGKIINTGTKNIVVGISTPGLYESLNLKELKDMDTITISYDTEKFELSSIYSVATSKLIDNDDLKIFDKMDNLYEKVDTLQTSINQIDEGSKKLNDGLNTLNTNYKKFNEGLDLVNKNFYTLNNGVQEMNNKINDILNNEDVKTIIEYLPKLEENAKKLKELTDKYSKNINTYLDYSSSLLDNTSNDLSEIIEYLQVVEDYLSDVNNFKESVNNTTSNIKNKIDEINEYLDELNNYLDSFNGISSFTNSSLDYIISTYESDPDNASEELTKLYNEAIKIKNNVDLNEMDNFVKNGKVIVNKLKQELNNSKLSLDNISTKLLSNEELLEEKLSSSQNICINVKEVIKKVKAANDNLNSNINKAKTKLDKTVKIIDKLPDNIHKVEVGINDFSNGIKQISDGTQKLQEGISTLSKYSNEIEKGINELSNGSNELSQGISKFNEEGINKISKLVNSNVKSTIVKTKELIKLGQNYESFAGKSNMKGETKFIFVIDGKVIPKDNNINKKENKKLSFWDRIVNLFR